MRQPLYVFDMDDTLIQGDSSMLWNQFLVDKGLVSIPNFLEKDRELMGLYAIGKMDMEVYLDFVMQPLQAIPISTVDRWVEEFIAAYIQPRIYHEARQLIDELKRARYPMLVISATVSFIVSRIAMKLGIEQAIGIDMAVKDGCYTSSIEGVPSYREGKIRRLKSWLNNQTQSFDSIHFYTDSINDFPLCEYADHVYLVNPCPQLREAATGKNWSIYQWHQVR